MVLRRDFGSTVRKFKADGDNPRQGILSDYQDPGELVPNEPSINHDADVADAEHVVILDESGNPAETIPNVDNADVPDDAPAPGSGLAESFTWYFNTQLMQANTNNEFHRGGSQKSVTKRRSYFPYNTYKLWYVWAYSGFIVDRVERQNNGQKEIKYYSAYDWRFTTQE